MSPPTPEPPASPAPPDPSDPSDDRPSMADKVDAIHQRLVRDRGGELFGMLEILGNRRRLMWLNFSAGLARGVGFFMGVTIVGALLLAAIAFAFNAAVSYMGFKDITLEDAVKATVRKFSEIEKIAEEAQEEVKDEEVQRHELERLAPVEPDPNDPHAPHEPDAVPPR